MLEQSNKVKQICARVSALAAVVAAALGGLAGVAGTAGASPLSQLDCSQTAGGDYVATPSGNSISVTLSADCANTPYYLVVYSASNNKVDSFNGSPCSDPVSACIHPDPSDFPQYLQSTVQFTGSTATATLPSSCWQVDVVEGPFTIPGVLGDNGAPFVGDWGEVGPLSGTCTPGSQVGAGPFTIGYWKHWNSCTLGSLSMTAAHPLMDNFLPVTLGTYVLGPAQVCQAAAILGSPSAKYAENQLAAQLLAAELDLGAGAPSCPAVQQAVGNANTLLASIDYAGVPSSVVGPQNPQRPDFVSTASTLNSYNNGQLC
jgi:hypothetical protein